jgi:hypothetical protein
MNVCTRGSGTRTVCAARGCMRGCLLHHNLLTSSNSKLRLQLLRTTKAGSRRDARLISHHYSDSDSRRRAPPLPTLSLPVSTLRQPAVASDTTCSRQGPRGRGERQRLPSAGGRAADEECLPATADNDQPAPHAPAPCRPSRWPCPLLQHPAAACTWQRRRPAPAPAPGPAQRRAWWWSCWGPAAAAAAAPGSCQQRPAGRQPRLRPGPQCCRCRQAASGPAPGSYRRRPGQRRMPGQQRQRRGQRWRRRLPPGLWPQRCRCCCLGPGSPGRAPVPGQRRRHQRTAPGPAPGSCRHRPELQLLPQQLHWRRCRRRRRTPGPGPAASRQRCSAPPPGPRRWRCWRGSAGLRPAPGPARRRAAGVPGVLLRGAPAWAPAAAPWWRWRRPRRWPLARAD